MPSSLTSIRMPLMPLVLPFYFLRCRILIRPRSLLRRLLPRILIYWDLLTIQFHPSRAHTICDLPIIGDFKSLRGNRTHNLAWSMQLLVLARILMYRYLLTVQFHASQAHGVRYLSIGRGFEPLRWHRPKDFLWSLLPVFCGRGNRVQRSRHCWSLGSNRARRSNAGPIRRPDFFPQYARAHSRTRTIANRAHVTPCTNIRLHGRMDGNRLLQRRRAEWSLGRRRCSAHERSRLVWRRWRAVHHRCRTSVCGAWILDRLPEDAPQDAVEDGEADYTEDGDTEAYAYLSGGAEGRAGGGTGRCVRGRGRRWPV